MVLVQKWRVFQLFFSGNIGQENVFYDILERKYAFLTYKNKKFKKSKNCHFCNGFGQKFGFFSIVCVWAKQGEKYCLLIFQIEKKVFFNIKMSFQKVAKFEFLQRGQSMVLVKNGNFFHTLFLAKIGLEILFARIIVCFHCRQKRSL